MKAIAYHRHVDQGYLSLDLAAPRFEFTDGVLSLIDDIKFLPGGGASDWVTPGAMV